MPGLLPGALHARPGHARRAAPSGHGEAEAAKWSSAAGTDLAQQPWCSLGPAGAPALRSFGCSDPAVPFCCRGTAWALPAEAFPQPLGSISAAGSPHAQLCLGSLPTPPPDSHAPKEASLRREGWKGALN